MRRPIAASRPVGDEVACHDPVEVGVTERSEDPFGRTGHHEELGSEQEVGTLDHLRQGGGFLLPDGVRQAQRFCLVDP